MKNKLLTSGLLSIVLSAADATGEVVLSPPDIRTVCGEWIENVQTCEDYYNGKKTSGVTRQYRDKFMRIDSVTYASDGTNFNEAISFMYDDNSRVDQMDYFLAGKLHMRYLCWWSDRGIIIKELVYDSKDKLLQEAYDTNEDGRMEMIARSRYDKRGKLTERTLDRDGDGRIDAVWDLEKWKWIQRTASPAKKVYIKGY